MRWKRTLGEILLLGLFILAFDIRLTESLYPPPTEWTGTYGIVDNHEETHSLIQTDDGGYAMLGFTQHYYAGHVYTSDFWLVKTDPAGNVEWNRTYGAPSIDNLEWGQSVVQTDDGGYAMAGIISTDGGMIDWDFWLVKADADGNMMWNQTYGGADRDFGHCVVMTGDGGYAVAGRTASFGAGDDDFWLVKTDADGNMMWNQTYGGANSDGAFSVVQTSDGGYAMTGRTKSFGAGNYDFWLVKADSDGNMMWNQTYGGTEMDWGFSVVRTSDGGYAVAGRTASFGAGDDDFWLVKTDADGNMMWNQTYGGMQIDIAHSMVQTSDGGYALLGWTNSFGATDYWLVKTDPTGNMEWYQTYGEELGDTGYAVVQTVDGGYAMAGESNYYINSSYAVIDAWLVKTGSGGDVNGDGVVDIFDLSIVGLAYGSFEGDPHYNSDADLTRDGLVDGRDLAIVTLNYGRG